jgi:hypothetical protein
MNDLRFVAGFLLKTKVAGWKLWCERVVCGGGKTSPPNRELVVGEIRDAKPANRVRGGGGGNCANTQH